MKHDFIDKYSNLDSLLHKIDPRIHLLLSFSFLILIASTFNLKLFAVYFALVIILLVISRVPLHFHLKKLLVVTPLVVVLSFFIILSYFLEHKLAFTFETVSRYHPVYQMLALMIAKIYLSILVITLLISCTPFNGLLWGLRKFRLPVIVTTLSKLVYTYIFVFVDELHRTMRAYKSRTPVLRISRFKLYGNIAAGIFLRSMERSDIIYKAMVSRGFTGEFPEGNVNRIKFIDIAAVVFFLVFVITVRVVLWKI